MSANGMNFWMKHAPDASSIPQPVMQLPLYLSPTLQTCPRCRLDSFPVHLKTNPIYFPSILLSSIAITRVKSCWNTHTQSPLYLPPMPQMQALFFPCSLQIQLNIMFTLFSYPNNMIINYKSQILLEYPHTVINVFTAHAPNAGFILSLFA